MIEILLILILFLVAIALYILFSIKGKDNSEVVKDDFKSINENITKFDGYLDKSLKGIGEQLQKNRIDTGSIAKENRDELKESLKDLKESIDNRLKSIQEDSTKQLDKMRDTVDEKLQKTLEKRISESFKQVSERLEQVHKGLGEMQTIATGVGDLKKVLSNVKTKGTFGEYQLGNILEQILTPEQYEQNVQTNPDYNGSIEFAVKLPGSDKENTIWLPIDSKFPTESYEVLLDEYETGDKEAIEKARKNFISAIDKFAKEISSKYIAPPHTTDFGVMFLPVEGLFAEALREPDIMGKLREKYKITLTGPTTLSALLNSLRMGFNTLLVQERSSEVWNILAAVKSEFATFGAQLSKVRSQLSTASSSLEALQGTRSRAMERKMRDIDLIDAPKTDKILGLEEEQEEINFDNPE
ncbi:MAG: DNA recombination protein RmuC [Candidatus Marinimicrobia bacterium]|nr:DNA recombination protein RmuC [Candidatus Neomarinimicrobiota bacterium]